VKFYCTRACIQTSQLTTEASHELCRCCFEPAGPSFESSLAYYEEDVGVFEVCVNFNGPSSQLVNCRLSTSATTAFSELCGILVVEQSTRDFLYLYSITTIVVAIVVSPLTGGSDYVPVFISFDMAGQSRVCHEVMVVDDEVPEDLERFSLWLYASNSEISPNSLVVNIADNDCEWTYKERA